MVEPGDVAPDIDLPDDEGRRWRLRDHRGRPVVLIFHRHLA
jgi:peroxiredoxin